MVTDRWLTLEELSEYLKLSLSKLYKMSQNGDIPGCKIGVQWRFDREEIDEWMKTQRSSANENLHGESGGEIESGR